MSSPVRLAIAPVPYAALGALQQELGVSEELAQVLARRGLAEPAAARTFLDADVRHPRSSFGGLAEAAGRILGHVRRGTAITVHGDYDVDGVCSTAVLVRVLRRLGGRVDLYLPSRTEDGYGLSLPTVERLTARGTGLLITVDCGITAVEEVAAAQRAGMDVIVTDHHSPRADGALPDAPIVHPAIGGYPCPQLCAAGVAHLLAGALLEAAGEDPSEADEDLDLVALATVADVVPLIDENRRLVREGLAAIARTRKPGLRALMQVGRVEPTAVDASAIGFRLAPRINAAGRLYRADVALELLMTEDADRARQIADELDAVNNERRDVELRMRIEAEGLVDEQNAPDARGIVVAQEGWHPGVVGIVASRIAERRHRPVILIALDGDEGSGSGRSIPGFDLLAGMQAGAEHLMRFGGHRAAAGLTIQRERIDLFRAAFAAHARDVLSDEDLVPSQRIDAVVRGDSLQVGFAEELERLAPFGMGNPGPTLLVPGARLSDPRPLSEGKHVAFTLTAGGARSRAVMFGEGGGLPAPVGEAVNAVVRLELNRWNGTVEPRLVAKHITAPAPGPIVLLGEPEQLADGALDALERPLVLPPGGGHHPGAIPDGADARRERVDRRGHGIAGAVGSLVATGEPVLVVCASASHRAAGLGTALGGFALCSWESLQEDPSIAAPYRHVVALDPPAVPAQLELAAGAGEGWLHLLWGRPELDYAERLLHWGFDLREHLVELFRDIRAAGAVSDPDLGDLLRGSGSQPRHAALAGRLLRVLVELRLVTVELPARMVRAVPDAGRTHLENSPAFRHYQAHLQAGRTHLAELRAAHERPAASGRPEAEGPDRT